MTIKISTQFEQLLHEPEDKPVSLGSLMAHFGLRSYGMIMLALALPNMLPIYIPGLSLICGLPIFLLGYQMARRRPHPTLPQKVRDKSFARKDFQRIIERALPALRRIEAVLKPRWPNVTDPKLHAFYGGYLMFLSAFMLLPLPGTNIGPAFAIAFLALGLSEEDGLFIVIGLGVGIIAAVVTTGIIGLYLSGLSAGIGYFL